ncbi:MAG: 50S ribosomal protein L23 [Minisyncoccia bacterium]
MNKQENKKNLSSVIRKPRVTEKAGIKAETQNVYTFEINNGFGKKDVAEAVKEIYKVTPIKINITNLPPKNVVSRGKKGVQSGVKKAIVFLKKGDKIEFI